MGTDAIDFFVRSTRYIAEDWQLGSNLNYQERGRGEPVHENKREVGVDLTWWFSRQTQFAFGYTYQRIQNPGQISAVVPFVETFAAGVTASNHLFWTNMTMSF